MSKVLTRDIYKKYAAVSTPNGFTFDNVIQTGVDNPGHPFIMTVGCVAGDEESYAVFSEFFDPIIEGRHGGYSKDAKHSTDLNHENLIGEDDLDPEYVFSCRVRTGRSIRGYCLPPFCTRAERRKVETIVTDALKDLAHPFEGKRKTWLWTSTESSNFRYAEREGGRMTLNFISFSMGVALNR